MGVLTLVEDGKLSLEDPVGRHLEWLADHWIGQLTVKDLLTHNSNLHRVGAVVPMIVEPVKRGPFLKHLPEEELDGTRGYSDFAGWFLLAHIVEVVTGQDHRDVVLERVGEPYGIHERDLNLGIPAELLDEWMPQISVNLYRREDTSLHPLAAEAAPIWACDWNPPQVAYGSSTGLVAFYRGVLDDLAGAGRVLSVDMARAAITGGDKFYDNRLKRDSRFGLGFMVDLSLFRLGSAPSERSFGHVGVGGVSVAFADPEHDLAGTIIFNTVFDEDQDLLIERGRVMSAVYADLGLREMDSEAA
jgi:CubicO group peptidase (beta-lactamase class C family)